MFNFLIAVADHKSFMLCTVAVLLNVMTGLMPILTTIAVISTIVYNLIKIYKELKK
jgi:hypothetical protein